MEPLALLLFSQGKNLPAPEVLAEKSVDPEKGVETVEDALAGASDIIAERISDDADIRKRLRQLFEAKAAMHTVANTEEDTVYRLYYDFTPALKPPSEPPDFGHQPGRAGGKAQGEPGASPGRGARAHFPPGCKSRLHRHGLRPRRRRGRLRPAVGALFGAGAAQRSHRPRLRGGHRQLCLEFKAPFDAAAGEGTCDHGARPRLPHGLQGGGGDATGKVLDTAVVYPTYGEKQKEEAITKLSALVRRHGVTHIAIGNGTASRETEQMAVELIRRVGNLSYMMVSEAGASVYSASPLAAEEFPQFDVNLRSAVSIARRLQDPLAELVKIDPKAIGVGQYQHDMPPKRLDEALGGVVEDCVNAVGVDVNTASPSLLKKVAGLTPPRQRILWPTGRSTAPSPAGGSF